MLSTDSYKQHEWLPEFKLPITGMFLQLGFGFLKFILVFPVQVHTVLDAFH